MKFTSDDLGGLDLKLGHKAVTFLSMCISSLHPNEPFNFDLSVFREFVGADFYPEIARALTKAGLLQKSNKRQIAPEYSSYYLLSDKGQSIAKGNTLKRMPRAHLEKLFAQSQQKILEVQSDNRFVYEFGFVAIMGSYLRDEPDYGDLDLVYEIKLRDHWARTPKQLLWEYHLDHWPGDSRAWLPADRVMAARPRRYVQSVSPQRIDMTPFEDFVGLMMRQDYQMPYRILIGDINASKKRWLAEYHKNERDRQRLDEFYKGILQRIRTSG